MLTRSVLVLLAFVACCDSTPAGVDVDAGAGFDAEPVPDACSGLAVEVCGDFRDNTCDGLIDEGCPEPGSHLWAKDLGGPLDDDLVSAVVVGPDGHSTVLLLHDGEATFGRGESNATLLPADHPHQRLISAGRYGDEGELIWARRLALNTTIQNRLLAESMVQTSDNGLLVAGSFEGTVIIGPDSGAPVALTSPVGGSGFVARYGDSGDVVWAHQIDNVNVRSLALLNDGRVAVAGFGFEEATFDPGGPAQTVISAGVGSPYLAFVGWYGGDGTFERAATITDYPENSMQLLAGPMGSTQLFGTGRVAIVSNGSPQSTEVSGLYRCAFASDGSIEDLDLLAEAASQFYVESAAHDVDGSVFLTGSLRGAVTLAPGLVSEQILGSDTAGTFIIHLLPDLEVDWYRVFGGVASGSGLGIVADPLVLGGAVVSGYLGGEVTLGEGEVNETTLGQSSTRVLYVARFDDQGNLRWVRSPDTQGAYNRATALAIRPDHTIVTVGQIGTNTVFGDGQDNASSLEVQHTAQGFIAVLGL